MPVLACAPALFHIAQKNKNKLFHLSLYSQNMIVLRSKRYWAGPCVVSCFVGGRPKSPGMWKHYLRKLAATITVSKSVARVKSWERSWMCSRVWLGLQLLKIMEVKIMEMKTVMRRQLSKRALGTRRVWWEKWGKWRIGIFLSFLPLSNTRGMSLQQWSKVGSSYLGPIM